MRDPVAQFGLQLETDTTPVPAALLEPHELQWILSTTAEPSSVSSNIDGLTEWTLDAEIEPAMFVKKEIVFSALAPGEDNGTITSAEATSAQVHLSSVGSCLRSRITR